VVVATNDAAPTQRPRLRNAMIASNEAIAGAPGSDRLQDQMSGDASEPSVGLERVSNTASGTMAASLSGRDKLRQFSARVIHARLHRGLVNANDFGNLLDGLAVVVSQADDLAVLRR
jgi:hypothetical protein